MPSIMQGQPSPAPSQPSILSQPAPQPQAPQTRAFGDADATRKAIYDGALAAAGSIQPISNSRYSLELGGLGWADPDHVSLADQKKAIMEGTSLQRRLRGTWTLKDAEGNAVDSRASTIAHVPHLTQRGTFILGGTEYTLAHQMRLRAGVYHRQRENGELEAHVNVLPGKGLSHRYRMEPETGIFKVDIGQASLPLMPVLRALGASDQEMRDHWGTELHAANAAKDDPRVVDKLYARLVRKPDPQATADQKREALAAELVKMELDPEVTQRTLGSGFRTLDKHVVLASTRKLLALSRAEADPDDRDHLAYQTFMGPEDLIAERLGRDRSVLNQLLWKSTYKGNLQHMPAGALTKNVHAAILSSGLGQGLEEVNASDVFDQQTRVSRLGYGGINSIDAVPDECYDSSTEVFTAGGWMPWPLVGPDTQFACLVGGRLEYHLANRLICKPYRGVMYGIKTRTLDILVTPTHRHWVRKYRCTSSVARCGLAEWGFELAQQTHRAPREFLIACEAFVGEDAERFCLPPVAGARKSYEFSFDDWAELVGWYASEGSLDSYALRERSKYQIVISQTAVNQPNVDRIDDLLRRMGIAHSWQGKNCVFVSKQLGRWLSQVGTYSLEKRLPETCFSWPASARFRLLEALILGDGSHRDNGDRVFGSGSQQLLWDVSRLATSLGLPVRERKEYRRKKAGQILGRDVKSDNPYYVCGFLRSQTQGVTSERMYSRAHYTIDYDGLVYCAEVPGEKLLVRRHQSVPSWSGNSRSVQPSHLGYVDLLRSPESFKAGVDSRIAFQARKGSDGKIYTPFQDPRTGQTVYKSPQDVADLTVAFPNEMRGNKPLVAAMIKGKTRMVPREQVDLAMPHMENAFSPLTNLIPLKSTIKGQRVAMGSRFITQALPLVGAEAPYVRSQVPGQKGVSFEEHYGRHMGTAYAKDVGGRVLKVTPGGVTVRYADGTTEEHELYDNFPYNRKTFQHSTPLVREGDPVRPGQLLAKSNYTDDRGAMALGVNARMAYMPFKGLNYEDAFVVSEGFAKRLSSEHMYQHSHEWDERARKGKKAYATLFPTKYDRKALGNLDDHGVVLPGTTVNPGDPLILAAVEREITHKQVHSAHKGSFADRSVTWDHHQPGVVTDVAHTKKGVTVAVKSLNPTQVGDKISGRYGDKGVISGIIPDHEMPHDDRGRPYEVLSNPLGVISRCYDDQTEFLTSSGVWKKGADVLRADRLMCFDPADWGLSYLEQLEPMHVSDYDAEMLYCKDANFDFCVTPDHKVLACLGTAISYVHSMRHYGLYDLPRREQRKRTQGWWVEMPAAEAARQSCLLPRAIKAGRGLMREPNHTLMTEVLPEHWRKKHYAGKVYCPTVPTGYVVTRRRGKMVCLGNTNPGQVIEAALGKIAEKTGRPYVVEDFDHEIGDVTEWAQKQLAQHGLSDMEDVTDPTTGRKVKVLTGNRFVMKLSHTSESKGQGRGLGAYTAEETPARGGEEGSKKLALMDVNALLSHGATEVLRDGKMVRGQKNQEYWTTFMGGFKPPSPKVPFVYHKFINQLRAAGINVVRKGTQQHLMALTDRDVEHLSGDRAIENTETVDWKTGLKPIPGGLFDVGLTGGHAGGRWAHIKLHEPLPNPAFEEPIRRLLGLTQQGLEDVLAGREKLRGQTGPKAVQAALAAIDLPQALAQTRADAASGRKTLRDAAVRKLGYLKACEKTGIHPREWVLSRVPVIPPAFRPVSVMQNTGGQLVNDANYLYKELFDADKVLQDAAGKIDDLGQERMNVYNAFKAVVGLGDPVQPKSREKQIKGMLKQIFGSSSKFGTVQQKLLGSSVELVGRAVVTPNPDLDMDEVGLPEARAWEVYTPFIVRRLVRRGMGRLQALQHVKDRHDLARRAMLDEMDERPVLVNRAPVLHRYGMLAFKPRLTKGDVLQVSPIVVGGFGMDFDGDASNYQVPAEDSAREEAMAKMLPSKNLISVSSLKQPMYQPRQEYVGGLYAASTAKNDKRPRVFATAKDAVQAYHRGELDPGDPVEILDQK